MSKQQPYCVRGKLNPFDAYMAGMSWWVSPRQILILDEMFSKYTPAPGVDAEAFEDMKTLIAAEAAVKRKRYQRG